MIENILGGVVVAFVSGSIGAFIGGAKKVNINTCAERRQSCLKLIMEKLENIENNQVEMKRIIDSKLLGI